MVAIHHAADNSPRAQAKRAQVQGGAPRGRLHGGHIHDCVALGKAILLSETEARKFNAKAVGYATNPLMPRVSGYSDASGEFVPQGILFLKKD